MTNNIKQTEKEIAILEEQIAISRLSRIKSRVAKDNFIRKMTKKGIYL